MSRRRGRREGEANEAGVMGEADGTGAAGGTGRERGEAVTDGTAGGDGRDLSPGPVPDGDPLEGDPRTHKTRMLQGALYHAGDSELLADYGRAQAALAAFNAVRADDNAALHAALSSLLGGIGEGSVVKPAFRCDYGRHITLGPGAFVNYDCVFLDCAAITIGAEVLIGPGVHIYTATHPLEAPLRRAGWESARPVTIGDGAWLGGRSVVCPGVTIGENTVVGAGSVVTKDLPAGVLAAGTPCRVLRAL